MFNKEVYISRRKKLKELVGSGLVLIMGNNEAPYNYPSNAYSPFRQNSSFLYYFGQKRDGLAGVIDIDNDRETLVGNDIDLDDIVWLGSVDSIADMAAQVGVQHTAPMAELKKIVEKAKAAKQTIHFLPPYRHDIQIQLMDLLGIHPGKQREAASLKLIKAIVAMRSTKSQLEIDEIERACHIGYMMHTAAMAHTSNRCTERQVAGMVDGIARSFGAHTSFPTIYTQHGEIMHGEPTTAQLQDGKLALCDAGSETLEHYCSDHTRTIPVSGKFTQRQAEIYNIVVGCHDYVLQVARPGVKYFDVHLAVCRQMTQSLKELGLMKGDVDEAVAAGAHALFLPHGLGHMMGMDAHDMEDLGQINVGYDEETRPRLDQFGTNALRMGRRLQEGFVVSDEPGIYFIPDLIDEWKAKKHCDEFICYEAVEKYKDFGGIRIEDDLLITADGCRFLGNERIPYHINDVEEFLAKG